MSKESPNKKFSNPIDFWFDSIDDIPVPEEHRLKLKDICEEFDVHYQTVNYWIQRGSFPRYRIRSNNPYKQVSYFDRREVERGRAILTRRKGYLYARIDPIEDDELNMKGELLLKEQELKLIEYCEEYNIEIEGSFSDIGYSTDTTERIRFMELLELIIDKKVSHVITLRSDTLASNIHRDILDIVLAKNNVKLIIVDNEYNEDIQRVFRRLISERLE